MEIKFDNVCYKNKLLSVCLDMSNNKINGVYNYNSFIKVISNPNLISSGNIFIDNKVYKKIDPRFIAIIDKEKDFYAANVIDEILFHAKIRNYKSRNIKNEIEDLLGYFNLDSSILKRIGHSLSTTEKYFIKVIANLIYRPKIVIFKNVMSGMDYNSKKKIKTVINKLKEQGTLVILTSMDSNILYELSEELFIFDKGNLLITGDTNDVYSNIEVLLKNNVEVPYFSKLTYKANNEKGANLFYRKDVRDVIKDVYKSVS